MNEEIDNVIAELKHDIYDLKQKVDQGIFNLAGAITALTTKIGTLGENMGSFIPIKVVYLLFVLVFGLVFGIEAVKAIIKYILGAPL